MSKPLINPDDVIQQTIDWDTLRKALRTCILLVAPNARVYSSWPLKYDIKQTINLLQSQSDNNKVHCWMISISETDPEAPKAGGYYLEWEINVRIWGFVGYGFTHDDATQSIIEDEVKKITQVLYLNQKHLGMDISEGLEVGLLKFNDIDVHAFGSGADVHVAQGNMKITIREQFGV